MNKLKPLIRCLQNVKAEHEGVKRLLGVAGKIAITYPKLAQMVNEAGKGNLYILDSGFIGRHEVDDCMWEALLDKTIGIPRYAWRELEDWRTNPFSNKRIARIFSGAEREKNKAIVLDHQQPWGRKYRYGRAYYNTLLAQRKRRATKIVTEFEVQNGRTPSQEDLNRLFQKHGGERDFHLLRKGYQDRHKKNFFADEDVVVTAVMAGLRTGRPTTILSRDADLLEQFYKFCVLLTVHYQAMLFAEMYAWMPDMFTVRPMPRGVRSLEKYFDCSDGLLVKKPVDNPAHLTALLLPITYQPVFLSCFLLGGQPPDMTLTAYNFVAERDMDRVIRVKGATMGLNTDRFGGKNCHVTGLPGGIEDSRSWTAIVRDKRLAFPNGPLEIPLLDISTSQYHNESRTHLASDDELFKEDCSWSRGRGGTRAGQVCIP